MNNKNPPLTVFKIWLFNLVFLSLLTLLIPFISNAQIISPRISLTSSPDPAGIAVKIHGTGFSAGSTATLYSKNPDGSQSGILSMGVSLDGSFNLNHLFPTGYPAGTYLFWVVDGPTGRFTNRVNFNIPSTQPVETRIPPQLPPSTSPSYAPQHGDLIKAKGDTKVYLVQGQQQGPQLNYQRRGIGSEQVFNQMGFKWSDVKDIDQQDLMNIPEGPPILSKELTTSLPEGALIRLKGKPQTYVIQGGRKCYIPDPETFQSRGYSWNQVKEVDQATLDSIFTGTPIQSVKPPFQYIPPGQQPAIQTPSPTGPPPMTQPPPPSSVTPSQPSGSSTTQQQSSSSLSADGTLIKGSGPDIYLIQNGFKHLIPDMETFNAMGFNRNNVINVDDQQLENIPMGIPIPKKRK